ncbi:phytanoyl-CoA dioxygenase family protein [Paenibacillus psychroresistens]|uniref:phytanoyl-CoA dioxygenase family protein n=1 Tax=Paenibacillus psychroresistens TaxID=1778678 RepID=UPI00221FBACB|nr:phytanoyl-CoA dioxygenase family protein [Paenibacillus psychroresistens]
MTFASGSQKLGYAADLSINDESHTTLRDLIKAKAIETITYGAMAAGDVTFHNGWTMHSAPGNPTDQTREVMTIIYVADGARVAQTVITRARQSDLAAWIPGAEPGELIESHLNPILYKR